MRIFAVILLIFCLMPSMHAQADVFVKPNKSTKKQQTPIIDLNPTKREVVPRNSKPQPEPKQIEEPQAKTKEQTAVSSDMAKQYYNNCITQENSILTEESQEMLCACTSVKMTEEMSVEEIKTMFQNTKEGQHMRNVMLIRVYTPCMKFPARDLIYKSCSEDRAVSQNLKKPRKVCNCMADRMAEYTVEKAPDVITQAVRQDASNLDPLALLFDDVHFNAKSKTVMTQCLYKHEYGWK